MILNGGYVEKLTEEELYILKQLTYLDEMVAEKAGISIFFYSSKLIPPKQAYIC